MAEYRRPDRPADKSDEKNGERLEYADQRIRFGEEEFAEDQRSHLAVQQEIVPLDRGADRAGDHGAAQMRAMLCFGKLTRCDFGCRHRTSSQLSGSERDARCHRPPPRRGGALLPRRPCRPRQPHLLAESSPRPDAVAGSPRRWPTPGRHFTDQIYAFWTESIQ